jgi:hypothetical protein
LRRRRRTVANAASEPAGATAGNTILTGRRMLSTSVGRSVAESDPTRPRLKKDIGLLRFLIE